MYKISVIIPVYNAEKTITATLASAEAQTLSDMEIICVDDGSTDRSADLIHEWQKHCLNIDYIYQDNHGAGSARNKGMEFASGEYIAFMDADDTYPDRHALQKLYQAAKASRSSVCGGSASVPRQSDRGQTYTFSEKGWLRFSDYQFDFLFGRFIFKREFLNRYHIRFPELRIYEDPVFLVRALIAAEQFYAIPHAVYCYHGAHQIQKMTSEKMKDYLQGLRMELLLTSAYQLADLHRMVFDRLDKEACYYVEPFLYTKDPEMLSLLLRAEAAIDHALISLDEDYLLPAVLSLWHAAGHYMQFASTRPYKWGSHLIRKIHTK